MSEDNNKEIERIFNELMNSNSLEDVVQHNKKTLIQELLHMQESLLESVLNINSLIHATHIEEEFEIQPSILEILGPLYKMSEDFIAEAIGYNGTIDDYVESEEERDDGE